MWLSLYFILFSIAGYSAQVSDVKCNNIFPNKAQCAIKIEGQIQPGDSLLIPWVKDADAVFFGTRLLGSTGQIAGRYFFASFIPRVYSLEPIVYQNNPTLILEAKALLQGYPVLPDTTQVRVIGPEYPLRKIFLPFFLRILECLGLIVVILSVINGLNHQAKDGWNYHLFELRCFLFSIAVEMCLSTQVPKILVPTVLNGDKILFIENLCQVIIFWSITKIILGTHFSHRWFSVKPNGRKLKNWIEYASDFSALIALALLPIQNHSHNHYEWAPAILSLICALISTLWNMEWKKTFRRSEIIPILTYLSLLWAGAVIACTMAISNLALSPENIALSASYCFVLVLSYFRFRRVLALNLEGVSLVNEVREILLTESDPSKRVKLFAQFLNDEFSLARVSIMHINTENGSVLASCGQDAIDETQGKIPRKLGPFLKRVQKEMKTLYAPVAEELSKEIALPALKHSTLAVPILRNNEVIIVICLMASEFERIPPEEAALAELVCHALSLEVLASSQEYLLKLQCQGMEIFAEQLNGLALEFYQKSPLPKSITRIAIHANCSPPAELLWELDNNSVLHSIYLSYQSKIQAIWRNLLKSHGFHNSYSYQSNFLAISHSQPPEAWQEVGALGNALWMAHQFEKQCRELALRSPYRVLGLFGAKIVVGEVCFTSNELEPDSSIPIQILSKKWTQFFQEKSFASAGSFSLLLEKNEAPSFPGISVVGCHRESFYEVFSVSLDKRFSKRVKQDPKAA